MQSTQSISFKAGRLLLFSAFLFASFSLTAQNAARLTISNSGSEVLLVGFQGTKLKMAHLAQTWDIPNPGTIQLSIHQWQPTLIGQSEYKEIFNGPVVLTAGMHTEIIVSRFGKIFRDEATIVRDSWGVGFPGNTGGTIGNLVPVSEANFADIRNALKNEHFENNRNVLAKTIMKNNAFTTNQIMELCKLYNFEEQMLVFAQMAYAHCVDKGNYFKVAQVFKFPNYRKDLMDFIDRQ